MALESNDDREAGRSELGWWLLTAGALVVAHVFEHFVVHRGVVLPSVAITGTVAPWMWATLFAPELVVCFIAGWRLRSFGLVAIYAAAAAVIREAMQLGWYVLREPGHETAFVVPSHELAVRTPLVVAVYLLVIAVASSSGREERALDQA